MATVDASRYQLVEVKKNFFLLSNTSYSILEFLNTHNGEGYYSDISEYTGIPQASLYVFCKRLEGQGFIKRVTEMKKRARDWIRPTVLVKLACKPKLHELHLIR